MESNAKTGLRNHGEIVGTITNGNGLGQVHLLYLRNELEQLCFTMTIDDFSDMSAESIPEGRIVRIGWCGSPECGHKFEDKYDMKILGTPYRPEEWKGRCVCCGKEGCGPAYAARTL